MGFKAIESELSQISDKVLKIIEKKETLSDDTVSSFTSTIEKLKGGYEGLSDGLSKLSRRKDVSPEDMEYNILSLAQYWMDLNKLYKETDEVIRVVAKKGDITDEDREKLKSKTSRLDEMAGYISSLLEDME
jgi:predicted  nucleic acid-binding Zn-ribbon protein